MALTIADFFNAEEILQGLSENGHPEPATLIDQLFFSRRERIQSGSVRYGVRSGSRRLAPYVSDVIGNQTVTRTRRKVASVRLATIAPSMTITQDDIETRLEGAILMGELDRATALQGLQIEDTEDMRRRIVNTWETQSADLLTKGKAIIRGLGVDFEVDLWGDLGGDKPETTLSVNADKWDEVGNTATPLADVEDAMGFMVARGGMAPNVAIMGTRAVKRFYADPAVQRGVDAEALAGRVTIPEFLPNGARYHGVEVRTSLHIWSYGGSYLNQSDAETMFLDEDDVLLGNTNVDSNRRVYAPVSLVSRGLETWAFPNDEFNVNTRATNAPSEGFMTEVKSRTLPIIGNVQSFHCIHTMG